MKMIHGYLDLIIYGPLFYDLQTGNIHMFLISCIFSCSHTKVIVEIMDFFVYQFFSKQAYN